MYIDKYLSWNFHVLQLSKKLSRANGISSKLCYNAPHVCKSIMQYVILVLHMVVMFGVLTSEENLNKIEILQRKCLRIDFFWF